MDGVIFRIGERLRSKSAKSQRTRNLPEFQALLSPTLRAGRAASILGRGPMQSGMGVSPFNPGPLFFGGGPRRGLRRQKFFPIGRARLAIRFALIATESARRKNPPLRAVSSHWLPAAHPPFTW